jgi:activator of HSP90 ATPase
MTTFLIEDPRWIVQNLGEEGKNVNNWHFTEKDITAKVKEFLEHFFTNKKLFQNEKANLTATRLKHFQGDAYLVNRKK